jgi:hypothetical protein
MQWDEPELVARKILEGSSATAGGIPSQAGTGSAFA